MATDLTFAVAVGAGLLSFASPCVLPLVPAYVGQLTAVAVASRANGVPASRWTAVRHAAAYVLGFGLVHDPRRDRDVRGSRAVALDDRAGRSAGSC